MFHECRHVFPSGLRCHSPALHDSPFCYYHRNLRRAAAPQSPNAPLQFPVLEDKRSIALALTQILNALAAGRIDHRRAGLLLYGLQIAAKVTPPVKTIFLNTVRSLDQVGDDVLAPDDPVCEPPEDCRTCPKRDRCDDFEESDEDEGEEEKERVVAEEDEDDVDEDDDPDKGDDVDRGDKDLPPSPTPLHNALIHQLLGCEEPHDRVPHRGRVGLHSPNHSVVIPSESAG